MECGYLCQQTKALANRPAIATVCITPSVSTHLSLSPGRPAHVTSPAGRAQHHRALGAVPPLCPTSVQGTEFLRSSAALLLRPSADMLAEDRRSAPLLLHATLRTDVDTAALLSAQTDEHRLLKALQELRKVSREGAAGGQGGLPGRMQHSSPGCQGGSSATSSAASAPLADHKARPRSVAGEGCCRGRRPHHAGRRFCAMGASTQAPQHDHSHARLRGLQRCPHRDAWPGDLRPPACSAAQAGRAPAEHCRMARRHRAELVPPHCRRPLSRSWLGSAAAVPWSWTQQAWRAAA